MNPVEHDFCSNCGAYKQPVYQMDCDGDDRLTRKILRYEYDHAPKCPRRQAVPPSGTRAVDG